MNYELAKKLKDAGFPFRKLEGNLDEGISMKYGIDFVTFDGAETIYIEPILSELIEACGNSLRSINKTVNGVMWFCNENTIVERQYQKDVYITPEEAVATLWLELNKK